MLSRDDSGIQSNDDPLRTSCFELKSTERSPACLKFSFFLIGIGFLFPYNSVVTAIDFFAIIYFESIDFALGWLLLAPSMCILIATLKYGYWGSIYQRILFCFLLEGVLTLIIPLVRNVYIVFVGTFILGCLSAVLQGTLFSLLGFLGSDMMSVTQTGIGCSGVLVGLVRIITKIFIPSDIRNSTYLYFLLAFVMVIVDIAIYVLILHPSQRVQTAVTEDTLKNESLHSHKKRIMTVNEISHVLDPKNKKKSYNSVSSGEEHKINLLLLDNENEQNISIITEPLRLTELFRISWKYQMAVFLNYTLTLALFPGVISLMKWDVSGHEWFAVLQIFLFNFFDTIGKNMTTFDSLLKLWTENTLLAVSLCRLAFIPLFVMCVKPQIFCWQIAIVINALMGVSNGVVGTSGFCLGPQSPKLPKHEKGRTAQMLAVSLTSGLVAGASLAFLINFVMDDYL